MQFDSVTDALDHLLSYAGQDGDEAATYIMDSMVGLMFCVTDLYARITARDHIIADLRERVNELTGGEND